uniref:Uncharacterized protein n=1 Tax=Meloidogyne enterolobii TaxID=390850 RepID=A0A6V7UXC4_MELEN|nr:unnamed protein product [Meloidogyne enterolobii]
MPKPSSLFTKLQVRLKRFPRLDDGLESTDEEGESEFHAKKFPNPLFDGEIIETTPKMTGRRQRAVRFSEGQEGDYDSPNGLSPPSAPPRPPLPNSFPSGNAAALPPKPKSPQPAPRRSFSQISPPSIYYSQNGNNSSDENTWIASNQDNKNNFGENSQPPRPNRNNNNCQRANSLLRQMRNSESNEFDEPIECSSRQRAGLSSPPIYLFLEHQGETKLYFYVSFPLLESKHLHSNNVKIYIQKLNSPHGLFYELENLEDLEDSCVLRLFEQNLPSSPSFNRRNNVPIIECLSEPEINEWGDELNKQQIIRPASVLGSNFNKNKQKRRILIDGDIQVILLLVLLGEIKHLFITLQNLDRALQGKKLLSNTNKKKHEESLERQMATLCSLVQCALLPYREGNVNNNSERQMLQFDGALALADSTTSTTLSNGSECFDRFKNDFKEWGHIISELEVIKGDLDLLKQDVQRNTLNGNEMIQDVLNQIKRTTNLNTNLFQQNLFITNYLNRLFNVQSSLKNFESNLENTRSAVLNSTRRLKLDEVNELTTALGEIGRESVELKVEIPILQRKIEMEIRQTMERMAREERLLQEKLPLVDGFLRRCKTLANMMVTMKKLAIIQDEERPQTQRRAIPVRQISLRNFRPPITTTQKQQKINENNNNHPLDAILDELGENNKQQNNEIQASFTLRLGGSNKENGNIWGK